MRSCVVYVGILPCQGLCAQRAASLPALVPDVAVLADSNVWGAGSLWHGPASIPSLSHAVVQVRFADVRRQRSATGRGGSSAGAGPGAGAAAAAQKALAGLQGGAGVVVAPPPARTAATVAGVYGALAAWTLAQGLLEPSPAAAAADVPGAQLALATAATVYLLREQKRVGLGKAAALTLAGLVVGTFVGAAVQSWLRVDVIPLGVSQGAGGKAGVSGAVGVCVCGWVGCVCGGGCCCGDGGGGRSRRSRCSRVAHNAAFPRTRPAVKDCLQERGRAIAPCVHRLSRVAAHSALHPCAGACRACPARARLWASLASRASPPCASSWRKKCA